MLTCDTIESFCNRHFPDVRTMRRLSMQKCLEVLVNAIFNMIICLIDLVHNFGVVLAQIENC